MPAAVHVLSLPQHSHRLADCRLRSVAVGIHAPRDYDESAMDLYLPIGIVLLVSVSGCTQVSQTMPPRTATELYLLSVASENAVRGMTAEGLRGRLVYVDNKYANEKDHMFLVAEVRAKLLAEGVRIAETRDASEVILEIRTPGVSMDTRSLLLGIPGLPIGQAATAAGLPATEITTPELVFIKNFNQWGTAGVAYVAYWRETGEIVASSGPHIGRSYREDWSFFGIPANLSDIPPAKPIEASETLDDLK